MANIDKIIQDVSKSTLDEQMKKLCDKIMEEERPKFTDPDWEPRGPNTFLAIQIEDPKNHSFLCLEREMKEVYIICLMNKPRNKFTNLKRRRVWEVNEDKAEKILKFFAETLKIVKEGVKNNG